LRCACATAIYENQDNLPLSQTRSSITYINDKGEFESAKEFYKKVVQKTGQIKLVPAEIHSIKGRKKIMHKSEFDPLTRIKKELGMSA
jgi:hypothetical protein